MNLKENLQQGTLTKTLVNIRQFRLDVTVDELKREKADKELN